MSSPLDHRLHALDALRAGAMLLGVVLHAGLAFAPSWWFPFGRLAGHPAFDVLLEAIHGFRMELFFLLAGFFAERIARRDGVGGLLASRARRILAPLVVFALVVFAAELVFVRWCLAQGVTPEAPERWFWPRPYHLWFLYYLLFLEASFAGWSLVERFVGRSYERWIQSALPAGRAARPACSSPPRRCSSRATRALSTSTGCRCGSGCSTTGCSSRPGSGCSGGRRSSGS